MTTLTKIIVSTILGLLLMSCNFDMNFMPGVTGNGNVVTDVRTISTGFDNISANAGLDVYLTQEGTSSVIVEADENIQDMIKTYVENGTLYLTVEGNITYAESRKIMVTFENINKISSTSGSDVYSVGVIKADKLELEATSGSDMEIEVDAQSLRLEASSGADLKVSGKTYNLVAQASSGSDIKAANLISQICNADASSGADISINTKKELTATANSGGDIKYSGHPEKVKKTDGPSGHISGN